jgi:SagB-type dehydrogenase family enzyme
LHASEKTRGRRKASLAIFVQLNDRVSLESQADGSIAARFDGYAAGLGKFNPVTAHRAQALHLGLPLASLSSQRGAVQIELALLVQRLADRGLIEYRVAHANGRRDEVIIEPQQPDYRPQLSKLGIGETVVLSRFAYLRRRGNELILESPRSGALFRICDPRVAAALVVLARPQKIGPFLRENSFLGKALLALLLDCEILFKVDARGGGLRPDEGDTDLVLWDFHDLLFHTRTTEGRQANPLGGVYPYAGLIAPLAGVRPRWPGTSMDLRQFIPSSQPKPASARLLDQRRSTRDFDDQRPVTVAELSRFLDSVARVRSNWRTGTDFGDDGPEIEYTARPYPAAGSAYELELYLSVANCAGLARGFYHYDAAEHALVSIAVGTPEFQAMLTAAEFAMDAHAPPQILITFAARFGRISWKYSSIAYSLILKDVGVLIQTMYIVAADMGLGGCAIGTSNIDLFARMTGIAFHVEGPVGQFALGRGSSEERDPRA